MKFPVRLPLGRKITVTQPFGSTQNADRYVANGLPPTHNGLDTVFGTNQETYGTPLVCPFPSAYVSKITFDGPMSLKGNGITIGYQNLQVVFWHLSEVVTPPNASFKEGDVIGYVGNSGLCFPATTPESPYAGSHLHLMVYEDGVLKNPAAYFNINEWYAGEDDLTKDYPPLIFYLQKIIEGLRKRLGL